MNWINSALYFHRRKYTSPFETTEMSSLKDKAKDDQGWKCFKNAIKACNDNVFDHFLNIED